MQSNGGTHDIQFPVLIYRDEDSWVAQCLMTCTTAVARDPHEAAHEVCRLVGVSFVEALNRANDNMEIALQSITCVADPDMWRRFWVDAKHLPPHDACAQPTPIRNSVIQFDQRQNLACAAT